MTLLFAQISGKDSLREIENALLANHKRLYHLGMEAVTKSTLSEAMNRRNLEIFKALFEEILDRVMAVVPKHKFKFKNPLYAIDSTTIDLCLSRYNWAYYRKHKGAIKLHSELDLSGNLPCFLLMSNCSSNGILNTGICPRSKFRFLFLSEKPSDSISKAFPDRRSTAVSSLGKIRA